MIRPRSLPSLVLTTTYMSVAHSETPLAADQAGSLEPIDVWRSECHAMEDAFERLLEELETLRDEIQGKSHELQLTRTRLDERERQLAIWEQQLKDRSG